MRLDICPDCFGHNINGYKGKNGKWSTKCYDCGFHLNEIYDSRKDARIAWNKYPRTKTAMTDYERALETESLWFQIPRRKRARWFEEHGIEYNKEKLVPLDPKLRTNPTSSVNQRKRKEYKEKVARGEIKPNPKKHKKK